jgi:hypothetical protein
MRQISNRKKSVGLPGDTATRRTQSGVLPAADIIIESLDANCRPERVETSRPTNSALARENRMDQTRQAMTLLERSASYLRNAALGGVDQALKDLQQHARSMPIKCDRLPLIRRKILATQRRLIKLSIMVADYK